MTYNQVELKQCGFHDSDLQYNLYDFFTPQRFHENLSLIQNSKVLRQMKYVNQMILDSSLKSNEG